MVGNIELDETCEQNQTTYNIETGELYVFGDINADMARDVLFGALRMADMGMPTVNVYISSLGGSASQAITIIECLRLLKCKGIKLVTYALGGAASGAAEIFLCGDTRLIGKYCYFMLHNPQLTADMVETHALLVEATMWQDRTKDFLVDVLKPTKIDYSYYLDKTKGKDWVVSPTEAVKLGLADRIVNHKKEVKTNGRRKRQNQKPASGRRTTGD